MTKSDCERTEEEIDKLLNDPETPMYPDRIWALAEALAEEDCESADWLRQPNSLTHSARSTIP